MKLPRDVSGQQLVKALRGLGYSVTRQQGGHIRLTTEQGGQHHLTSPDHSALRPGTLTGIIGDVAIHFDLTREEVSERLFG